MAEHQDTIRALEEKLRLKEEEVRALQEDARSDDTHRDPSGMKKEAAPMTNQQRPKGPKGPQRNNYKYKNRPSHTNEDNYCYEEYHVTKRVFYPGESGFRRPHFPPEHRRLEDPRPMFFNRHNDFHPRFQRDHRTQGFQKNDAQKPPKSHFNEEIPCNEIIMKMRQNQQPFVIVKAFKKRTCVSCRKTIKVSSVTAKHREIECYPHPRLGWKEPMYSKNMITQFYHMDENCLRSHGFEKEYLNLCYIEVDEHLTDAERKLIPRCGFLRPAMEKKSKDINETKMMSLKLSDSNLETQTKEKESQKLESEIKRKVSNSDVTSTDEEDSYEIC